MSRSKAMPLLDQILLDNLESRLRVCEVKLYESSYLTKETNQLLRLEEGELVKQITNIKIKYPDNEES